MSSSDFTVTEDRELLDFVIKNAPLYDRYEIFLKVQEQVPILARKTILELHQRYHRFLFPLFNGQPSDETGRCFTPNEDRALLDYIIDNSKDYDRWEIFLKAQENEPMLKKRTILELYSRYHHYLFPLFTGKVSNENAGLEDLSIRVSSPVPSKITVNPNFATRLSDSGSDSQESGSSNRSSLENSETWTSMDWQAETNPFETKIPVN